MPKDRVQSSTVSVNPTLTTLLRWPNSSSSTKELQTTQANSDFKTIFHTKSYNFELTVLEEQGKPRRHRRLCFAVKDQVLEYPQYFIFFDGNNNYRLTKVLDANGTQEQMTREDLAFFEEVVYLSHELFLLRQKFNSALPVLKTLVADTPIEVEAVEELISGFGKGIGIDVGGSHPRRFWIDLERIELYTQSHPSIIPTCKFGSPGQKLKHPDATYIREIRDMTPRELRFCTELIEGLGSRSKARRMFLDDLFRFENKVCRKFDT